jgi:cytochrome c-type biogenesis protein CcmH/NrfG
MKPRFLCTDCQAEILWGDLICSSCGKTIEWPSGSEMDEVSGSSGPQTCSKCGSENGSDASYCNSCGARLQGRGASGGGKQRGKQSRQAESQRKGSEAKEAESTPLFSWKVIVAFLVFLVLLFLVLQVFPNREQASPPQSVAPTQAPAANMQLSGQISDLENRVAADPNDLKSILALANMCQDGRFFDKAITNYKRYLAKMPKSADARVDLGICYYETNNLEQAQKEMLAALKDDPKHLAAHFNLGIVNLSARRLPEANEWFKKTVALSPNSDMGQKAKQILEQHSSPLIQNK